MAHETFKREGPVPATGDSGDSIDEMNDAAAESVERNIAPDDDSTSRRDRGGMKGTDTPATTNAEDRDTARRTTM